MPLQSNTKPKYQLQVHQGNKYDWMALIVDVTGEAPNATNVHAHSLTELMAKCLIAVTLHDKNLGVDVPDDVSAPGSGVATGDSDSMEDMTIIAPPGVLDKIKVNPKDAPSKPIILTPNRKIVEP